MKHLFVLLTIPILYIACKQATSQTQNNSEDTAIKKNVIVCPPGSKLDVAKIEQIIGMKGVEKNGEYKITVPQNDLKILVDGFKIIPPYGPGKLGCIYSLW